MQIKISNIKVSVGHPANLRQWVVHSYPIADEEIMDFKILRESIDARKKDHIFYLYQVYVELKNEREEK